MSDFSRKIFMTSKDFKSTEIRNVSHGISSDVPVKTSLLSRARRFWLTILVSVIAVVGIVGTIAVSVVSFVVLATTTLSTTTTTSTTSTSTTTATRCFTIPSPRPSNAWLYVDSMAVVRIAHTSTFIAQDNSVLITGGSDAYSIFSSVQKYIPSTGCFKSMRNMPRTRYLHTADQLMALSGYVVISGGYGATGAINVADLYHPITGDILTIPLTLPRYRHTSVVLSSSQLVLIGGLTTAGVYTDSSDMLDIASNSSFVPGANTMTEARAYHAATLLGNNSGVVLITGGVQLSGVFMATAHLYQGSLNNFLPLGTGVTMTPARGSHSATYLPPPINKVLIVGGAANVVYGTMSLFDVSSLTFTTLTSTLIYPRNLHTATLLPNGKVLIVGGSNGGSLKTCELIDPSNNYTVTAAASLNTNRYYHTATLLPDSNNGTVLVCGGYNLLAAAVNTCELYFV